MRHVITLVSLTFFLALGAAMPAVAQQDGGSDAMIMSADDANLSDFKWKKRVLGLSRNTPSRWNTYARGATR